MPNWAELHEISETRKATHAAVGYTEGDRNEHCGNCKNFIPAEPRARCRTVECPIAEPKWCRRFVPGGP
jgi:hypothetical protein